jgi:hypothetical protein
LALCVTPGPRSNAAVCVLFGKTSQETRGLISVARVLCLCPSARLFHPSSLPPSANQQRPSTLFMYKLGGAGGDKKTHGSTPTPKHHDASRSPPTTQTPAPLPPTPPPSARRGGSTRGSKDNRGGGGPTLTASFARARVYVRPSRARTCQGAPEQTPVATLTKKTTTKLQSRRAARPRPPRHLHPHIRTTGRARVSCTDPAMLNLKLNLKLKMQRKR